MNQMEQRKMKNNVVLIGMPACGKSTIGVVLAKIMGKDFVDMDITIQHVEGRPLQQIIDENGNEYFKKVEEEILAGFSEENCIVATGGSAAYYDRAMEHLKENGVVVYLKVSLEGIESRLHNLSTRGVTLKPGQTIADLYEERIPYYEKHSDICIEAENMDIWETAEFIMNQLRCLQSENL